MKYKQGQIQSIRFPNGKYKSHVLEHWFGKRVTVRGQRGKVKGADLDKDMNFVNWLVAIKGKGLVKLSDPKFRPSFLPNYSFGWHRKLARIKKINKALAKLPINQG